jgi:hypothetical protein
MYTNVYMLSRGKGTGRKITRRHFAQVPWIAGHRAAIPFMVGLVAADLLAAFLCTTVGAAYWLFTGLTPAPVDVWGG